MGTVEKEKPRPFWGKILFLHGESPEGYFVEIEGERREMLQVLLDPLEENPIAVGRWISGFALEVGSFLRALRWKVIPEEKDILPIEATPFDEGFSYLTAVGFPLHTAKAIYQAWGPGAALYLRARPYAPAEEGYISLEELDRLYIAKGLPRLHPARTKGLTRYYLRWVAHSYGHTALDLSALFRFVRNEERLEAVMAGIALLIAEGEVETIEDKIALKSLYTREREIADFFSQSPEESVPIPSAAVSLASKLNEDQREAFAKAFRYNKMVLLGGPGTGKTTLTRALTDAWDQVGLKYVLLSPTGKGASRLRQATGKEAVTVHRFLYSRAQSRFSALVLDEAGLLSSPLLSALLRRIGRKTRVVLVGDGNQLPPVGPGSPLQDLAGNVPTHTLVTFVRQEDSSLIEAALRALEGVPFLEYLNGLVLPFEDTPPMKELWDLWKEREGFQVLVPWKPPPFGADYVNSFFSKQLGKEGLFPGMKLIGLRNLPSLNLWNGEVYRVLEATEDSVALEGGVLLSRDEAVRLLAPAFAITVHRAQGSEWEEVALLLPDGYASLLSRKLLYTAITRAKKRFHLLYHPKALEKALANEEEERSTALKLLLSRR
jgi:exodeoxyribonuclease V alpha subunit